MSWVRRSTVACGVLWATFCLGRVVAQSPDAPFIQPQQISETGLYEAGAIHETSLTQPPASTDEVQPGTGEYVPESLSGNLGCDMWNCCHACCSAGLYAGAELTLLAPLGEPEQRVVFRDLLTDQRFEGTSSPGLGAGIRTWLGMHCEGWGYRVTYWHFGDDTNVPDPTVPDVINGDPFFLEFYHLQMDVLDIELTQRMCFGGCRLQTSFGGRLARLERTSGVVGVGKVNDVELTGIALGMNEFEGCGFTFAINGTKPICCWCGWSTFWNFRGSALWGDGTKVAALTQATAVVDPPLVAGIAHARDTAAASSDSGCVFVTEFQAGLQYERCLCCLPSTFFFRAVAEYQHWDTGDAFARTTDFAFLAGGPPPFGGRVDATADAHDGDLDLFGISLAVGLTY